MAIMDAIKVVKIAKKPHSVAVAIVVHLSLYFLCAVATASAKTTVAGI